MAQRRFRPAFVSAVPASWRRRLAPVPHPWRAKAAASLGLGCLLLLYVTSFWGRAGLLLPPPLDNWHYVPYRALTRWSEGARLLLQGEDSLALYAGIEAYVLGLAVPAALLAAVWRRPPADLGLRWPDRLGWRWTLLGTTLAVPVGLWITAIVPPRSSDLVYAVRLLSMIPQHFLICGVGVAVLLPDRRLPEPRAAQAAPRRGMGLSPASVFAILGSATLFVVVHVGARPAELAFSVPMGIFCAYVTWRTASIWPALFSHWSLNLAPLGLRALLQ